MKFDFSLNNKSYLFLLILSFTILLILAYVPFIIHGGFIADDWGMISRGLGNKYIGVYKGYFPHLTNRPLVPAFLSLPAIFDKSPVIYNIFNFIIYLSSLIICSFCLNKFGNIHFPLFFLLISSFPIVSSVWVFSSVTFIGVNFSLLLFFIALYLILSNISYKKKFYFYFSYFLIIISWLIYDAIAFFLPLMIFFPILYYLKLKKNYSLRFLILKYTLPIIIITLLILSYQKLIVPYIGGQNLSRLKIDFNTIFSAPKLLWKFIETFVLKIPILLVTSMNYFNFINGKANFLFIILLVIVIAIVCFKYRMGYKSNFHVGKIRNSIILLVLFFSTSLIFVLSKSSIDIGTYRNRFLHPSWIMLSILMAYIVYSFNSRIIKLMFFLFVIFLTVSFTIQRDYYIKSYGLQIRILEDLNKKISNIENDIAPEQIQIIANVPRHFTNHYNFEEIFTHPWNFIHAINLYCNKKIKSGTIISKDNNILIKNCSVQIGYWKGKIEHLWYYEFDILTNNTKFIQINTADHLEQIIENFRNNNINEFNKYPATKVYGSFGNLFYTLRHVISKYLHKG